MNRLIVVGAAGRMGRMIANLAMENPNFQLVGAVDQSIDLLKGYDCPISDNLETILGGCPEAVIVDFTAPESSIKNAETCAANKVPLVIGTTGFNQEQKDELKNLAAQSPLLWSANMSIGVNVLMKILPELAKMLGPGYDMEMTEMHHRHKKDAPSGTALMLGEALAEARGWDLDEVMECGRLGMIGERPEAQIGIQAVRGGDVVGVHTAYFLGAGEIIEVRHQAQSRENFAQGALRAAQWLADKPAGQLYSMQDVISQ